MVLSNYRNLFGVYLGPQRARVALLVLALLAGTGLQLWNPQLVRQFIDAATAGVSSEQLLMLAGLFLLVALVTQAIQVGATYLSELVGWNATNRLRRDLVRHCLGLDRSFHGQHTPGEMIERVDGDVAALASFFSQLVIQVAGSALLLFGVLIALWWESALVGALMTVFVLLALLVLLAIRAIAVGPNAAEREARATLFGLIEERLAGLDDLRANGAGTYVIQRLGQVTRPVLQTGTIAAIRSSWIGMATMGTFVVGYLLAIGLGAMLFFRGSATIGTVFLLFQYTDLLRRPLEQLAEQLRLFQAAAAAIGRIEQLRAIRSAVVDGPGHELPSGALSVEFRNVCFAYEQSTTLENLNFALTPGRVLGVVGRTGSGKTTLTRLLLRQHDVQQGAIMLGGVDARDLTLAQLRSHIGIVTQDVHLFAASLRDNLSLFDERIADQQLLAALDQLGLSHWLAHLPGGLDHMLESNGRSLSAGEAQLIAFARLLLRDPGLVILDEASSRLDPATERLIENAVSRLLEGRTGIIIAHRLGTIERVDDLLLLEQGQIIEYGPRATLAADSDSRFAALLRASLEEVPV